MTFFRSSLIFALAFGAVCVCRAQSTTSGNISGRVTQHGKGLANVQVKATHQLTVRPDTSGYEARSDAQGYYQIRSMPAGHYFVVASEAGLVPLRNDQASGSPREVSVPDGETVSDVNFDLVVGGVISGAVTDSAGRPLAQQTVILTSTSSQPNPTLYGTNVSLIPFSSGYFRTDAQGLYHVSGIPPGSYLISIGTQFTAFPAFHGQPAYQQVFFPNATDRAHARAIEIAEGANLSNLDFKLGQPLATFSVKGRVRQTSNGNPAAGVALDLHIEQSGARAVIPKAVTSDASGEFQLDKLPAGHYSLEVAEERSGQKGEFFGASPWFDIRDADIGDVELRLLRTIGVVGRVSVANTNDPIVLGKVSELDLLVEVSPNDGGAIIFKTVRANANLTFSAYGLKPGRLNVYVQSDNQMATLNLRFLRLEQSGRPVRDVEIGEDKQVNDLRVVLIYGAGSVRGSVKLENGSLPPNTRIAVNIKDETGFNAGDWVDTNGNFLLKAIPPGNYTLNVTAEEPGKRTLGPAAHQTISVANDKVTTTAIALDLSSLKTP